MKNEPSDSKKTEFELYFLDRGFKIGTRNAIV